MANKITVAIASDHAGFELKALLVKEVSDQYNMVDLGTHDLASVDYPDYAELVVNKILAGEADYGVLICGSGIGMSIAANRDKRIRAALCYNEQAARLARAHNDANILVLGSRMMELDEAKKCFACFLNPEFEGGRHSNRVDKIS